LRTYEQLDRFVEENPDMVRELKILGFFSMVDRHKRLHRRFMGDLRTAHPEILVSTIPNSTDIERMGVHREPIGAYGKGSRPAKAYEALWSEIQARL
jgi:chromosome partitioning protein